MLQDYIRTSTYQRAILDNSVDFAGKVRCYLQSFHVVYEYSCLGRS